MARTKTDTSKLPTRNDKPKRAYKRKMKPVVEAPNPPSDECESAERQLREALANVELKRKELQTAQAALLAFTRPRATRKQRTPRGPVRVPAQGEIAFPGDDEGGL